MSSEPGEIHWQGPAVVPERLTEAREARGWSMAELGERIGVTRQAVSQFERGTRRPEPLTLMKLVREVGQPISYFTSDRPPGAEHVRTVFFRSFKSRTRGTNRALHVWRRWVGQIAKYLADYVDFPTVDYPILDNFRDEYAADEIEDIATRCRRHWGLGDGPIGDMTGLLESKGAIVTLSALGAASVDAFSCWQDERPFVFLGSDKGSACRSRFDMAHELAHLVMHGDVANAEIEDPEVLDRVEREANRFASSFLLPRRTFPAEVFSHRLAQFVELKRRWKVSIRAMAYRCSQVGIFDDDRMLNFWKQMSAAGYTRWEPLDDKMPFEDPRVLRTATELLLESRVKAPSEMVGDLRLSVETLSRACRLAEDAFVSPEDKPIPLRVALRGPPGPHGVQGPIAPQATPPGERL
jgi:Zn-dependent peptidase ImmA (M78 family)/transcriptional regulator with XRE-family HTH domain